MQVLEEAAREKARGTQGRVTGWRGVQGPWKKGLVSCEAESGLLFRVEWEVTGDLCVGAVSAMIQFMFSKDCSGCWGKHGL